MDHSTSHRLSLAFLVTVAITAGLSADAADGGIIRLARVLPDEPLFQCVAPAEYEIGGVRPGGSLGSLDVLGAPRSLTRGFGEDDGGAYVATTFHYGGLDVTTVRGEVDIIEARSPHWRTPSGLAPGMKRGEALALLGRDPDPEHLHEGIYSFPGCPEWINGELVWRDSWYFEFAFEGDRLSFVRLATDRP